MPTNKKTTNRSLIKDTENEPVYYANIAQVHATPEELMIHFGLRIINSENQGDGVAKVYLSLPHAKRLMLTLANILNKHEQNFGQIAISPVSSLTPEGRKLYGIPEEKSGEQNEKV